jgi:hypothetical protein
MGWISGDDLLVGFGPEKQMCGFFPCSRARSAGQNDKQKQLQLQKQEQRQ